MKLPDEKALGKGLKRWRESNPKSRRLTVAEVAAMAGVGPGAVRAWEAGKFRAAYNVVAEKIFPAYEIYDVDLFWDFCEPKDEPGDEVVVSVQKREGAVGFTINRDFGPEIRMVHPERLKGHRTRVDYMELEPKQPSRWNDHAGHEFILVIEGEIECKVGKSEATSKTYLLSKGEAIAFSSFIGHQVVAGKKGATIVIGRPAWSGAVGIDLDTEF